MLYRRFEQLIDIFRDAPSEAPPARSALLPLLPAPGLAELPALLVVGLFASLIEVALFSYLSRIIDLAQGTPNANFFSATAVS
jgi:ATP-binding cassette subfamily B multidrug efflux pump